MQAQPGAKSRPKCSEERKWRVRGHHGRHFERSTRARPRQYGGGKQSNRARRRASHRAQGPLGAAEAQYFPVRGSLSVYKPNYAEPASKRPMAKPLMTPPETFSSTRRNLTRLKILADRTRKRRRLSTRAPAQPCSARIFTRRTSSTAPSTPSPTELRSRARRSSGARS